MLETGIPTFSAKFIRNTSTSMGARRTGEADPYFTLYSVLLLSNFTLIYAILRVTGEAGFPRPLVTRLEARRVLEVKSYFTLF